jgi:hypothetical protein
VHLDGPTRRRLEVEDHDSLTARPAQRLDRSLVADSVRRPRQPTVAVWIAGNDGHDV